MAREESEAQRQARLARRRAADRAWREANRERLRAYHAAWKARNRGKVRETNARMYRQRSRDGEPQTLAQWAGRLRWNGLHAELLEEARREFAADCRNADFAMMAVAWFE